MAYHEIGHAHGGCLSKMIPRRCTKITIIPRTSGALGYTMQVDEGEHYADDPARSLVNKTCYAYCRRPGGGRTDFRLHSTTSGASNDIEQATKLARAMVSRFGMNQDIGMVALETVQNAYLGGDTSLSCSDALCRGNRP